jgi:hypothetical protein
MQEYSSLPYADGGVVTSGWVVNHSRLRMLVREVHELHKGRMNEHDIHKGISRDHD